MNNAEIVGMGRTVASPLKTHILSTHVHILTLAITL